MLVGSHIASRPSAIASRPAAGVEPGVTRPPRRLRTTARRRRGELAAKNRASNRRGRVGGVTHRDSGTSRSVRSRRSSSDARSGEASRRRRAARTARAATRGATRRRRLGQQDPGLLEQLADAARCAATARRREVAAERGCGLVRRSADRATATGPRPRIDPPPGRHACRRERHRRRPPREQDLGPPAHAEAARPSPPVAARPHSRSTGSRRRGRTTTASDRVVLEVARRVALNPSDV